MNPLHQSFCRVSAMGLGHGIGVDVDTGFVPFETLLQRGLREQREVLVNENQPLLPFLRDTGCSHSQAVHFGSGVFRPGQPNFSLVSFSDRKDQCDQNQAQVLSASPETLDPLLKFKLLLDLVAHQVARGHVAKNVNSHHIRQQVPLLKGKLSACDAKDDPEVYALCQNLRKLIHKAEVLSEYRSLADAAWRDFTARRRPSGRIREPRKTGPTDAADPAYSPLKHLAGMDWAALCEYLLFDPRDYQEGWLVSLVTNIEAGFDRGHIRSPYQTGKTLSLAPLGIAAGTRCFSGKSILVVTPHLTVLNTIKSDLKHKGLRLGFIDAKRKDFAGSYDLVVASALTLGRDENLALLDPERFGMIVFDEATFVFSDFGQKILKKMGFLNDDGSRRSNPGKFLLGFSADAYDMTGIFGEHTRLDDYELPWYLRHGYLHKPVGISVAYSSRVDEWETFTHEGETVSTPKGNVPMLEEVYQFYKKGLEGRFDGQKVIINCPTIEMAELVAAYFNFRERDGFAYACHSQKSVEENTINEEGYCSGTGPRVMAQIKKLAVGWRARGTVAVINIYESGSPRLYGQRVGRALGIHDGEEQRVVYVIDFHGARQRLRNPVTLPTLFGLEGYPIDGIEFNPINIQGPRNVRSRLVLPLSTGFAVSADEMWQAEVSTPQEIFVMADRFPRMIQVLLERDYEGSPVGMAEQTGIKPEDLERFVAGELPKNVLDVRDLEKRLGIFGNQLVVAWEDDVMMILERLYPLTFWKNEEVIQKLVRRVRLKALYVPQPNLWQPTVHHEKFGPQELLFIKDVLRGDCQKLKEDTIDVLKKYFSMDADAFRKEDDDRFLAILAQWIKTNCFVDKPAPHAEPELKAVDVPEPAPTVEPEFEETPDPKSELVPETTRAPAVAFEDRSEPSLEPQSKPEPEAQPEFGPESATNTVPEPESKAEMANEQQGSQPSPDKENGDCVDQPRAVLPTAFVSQISDIQRGAVQIASRRFLSVFPPNDLNQGMAYLVFGAQSYLNWYYADYLSKGAEADQWSRGFFGRLRDIVFFLAGQVFSEKKE